MITLARPSFEAIPPLTDFRGHQTDVAWCYLLKKVEDEVAELGLDLDPDFQRGHVWTEAQQVAFVEYALRGGTVNPLYFNAARYPTPGEAYVIVDGKQRLHAVCRFLRGEIRAFGLFIHEYADGLRGSRCPRFKWYVNTLETREQVLRWYLELNSGGTPHSQEELARVRQLLANEQGEW